MTILKSWNVLDCRYKPMAKVYDLILCEDRKGTHLIQRYVRVHAYGGRLGEYEKSGETVLFSNKGRKDISSLKVVREAGDFIGNLNRDGCLVVEVPIVRAPKGAL